MFSRLTVPGRLVAAATGLALLAVTLTVVTWALWSDARDIAKYDPAQATTLEAQSAAVAFLAIFVIVVGLLVIGYGLHALRGLGRASNPEPTTPGEVSEVSDLLSRVGSHLGELESRARAAEANADAVATRRIENETLVALMEAYARAAERSWMRNPNRPLITWTLAVIGITGFVLTAVALVIVLT